MRTANILSLALAGLGLLAATLPQGAAAALVLSRENVSWTTQGDIVRFQLRFYNPGPETSLPGVTEMHAQPFGAFAPNEVLVGAADLPPLAPDSFFDVFYEVSIGQLPASAEEITPSGRAVSDRECTPDDHWDGNVDIQWIAGSDVGQVNYHFGTLQVCPTAGYSYIHVIDTCDNQSTWSFAGVCSGWSASLLEEDLVTPAPALLPPFWTGWIRLAADGTVNVGDTCTISLTMLCNGVAGVIDLTAEACDCGLIPVQSGSWGSVKSLYD